ncbi:MAG: hypothetical protein FJ138_11215, partial [Deltaproteobacteria bacterium]|nr:hypothetical protein [Deltaproteobacteria bacterium]
APRYTLSAWLMATLACILAPPSLLFGAWAAAAGQARVSAALDAEARYHLESAEEDMRGLVELKTEILEVVAASFGALARWEPGELQRIASDQLAAAHSFKSLYLADMTARPLVFAPERPPSTEAVSYADRDYYRRLLQTGRASFGALVMGKQIREPSVHIAVPVRGQGGAAGAAGELRGFIVGGMAPSALGTLVTHALGHRPEYRGVLVDERGLVAHDTRGRAPVLSPLAPDGAPGAPLSCDAPRRPLTLDGEGVWAYCKPLDLAGLRWTLWVTLPQRVAREAAGEASWLALRGLLVALAATLALGALVSLRVKGLTRWVQRLAAQVAAGAQDLQLPPARWWTPRELALFSELARRAVETLRESQAHALEKERALRLFGQHVDPEIARRLLERTVSAEERAVTVLFTDLRGFTALSERVDPNTLLRLLNLHFNTIVPVIHAHGGTLNKFIGDAVMATFGVPLALPDHALRACEAAREMVSAMGALNARLAAEGLPALQMGVGVCTGPVVVGLMGTDERSEYAVLGDTVNTASRLEGLNKALATAVLLSESTHAALRGALDTRDLGELELKGKARPLRVFTLAALTPQEPS